MNRDEAEAAHHAAFLDKQERVFHRRQQVICCFQSGLDCESYLSVLMYIEGLGEVCISWKNLPTGEMWIQLEGSRGVWSASSQAQRGLEETVDLLSGRSLGCNLHATLVFQLPHISRIKKSCFSPPATQEECGAQMENQKAWQEHVEGHKAKLKAKIVNSVRWTVKHVHWQALYPCRSVLLYNKHGLLMDAFMKEYREACGRPLPVK